MKQIIIFLCFLFVSTTCFANQDKSDFRDINWGMSKEEVKSIETLNLLAETNNILIYEYTLYNRNVKLLYKFNEQKLFNAECIFYTINDICDFKNDIEEKVKQEYNYHNEYNIYYNKNTYLSFREREKTLIFGPLNYFTNEDSVFRHVVWGMSKGEVKSIETLNLLEDNTNSLKYQHIIYKNKIKLTYNFDNDKLSYIECLFYENKNIYNLKKEIEEKIKKEYKYYSKYDIYYNKNTYISFRDGGKVLFFGSIDHFIQKIKELNQASDFFINQYEREVYKRKHGTYPY